MVNLRLLGRINLTDPSGEEITSLLSQPKRMAVLAYLALLARGGYLRRDVLVALFWAESDISHARNALNQVLHALRKELGEKVVLTRGKQELGLNPEHLDCDVWSFRDAIREQRPEDALGLYGGPLLPGFHLDGSGEFERWLEEERERLRESAAGAAWALAHQHIRQGALVEAQRTAQRALALVGTDETPVRDFIMALAGAGDRASAMSFYEKFCTRLREDLDLEPSLPTMEVAAAIRNGDGSTVVASAVGVQRGEEAQISGSVPSSGGGREVGGVDSPGLGRHEEEAREVVLEPIQAEPAGEDPAGPPPPAGGRSGSRWWWWTGSALAAAFALVYLPSLRAPPPVGPPPPDRPFTVLADVEGSGDEEEREAVAFLLRIGLDMSYVVQTVPAPDVARTLALMEHPEGPPLDAAAARVVGARLGVATVAIPRLDRLGESYSLAVRLEDATSGRLHVAAQGQTGDVSGVVGLVDSLVLVLRRELGESRAVLAQTQPLPQVLTPSLEALQKYEVAGRLNASAQPQAAVSLLREAVALDTAFAMAWHLMAAVYGNYLNRPDSAAVATEWVGRFPHRLTQARREDRELHRRMRSDVALWDLALEEAERAVIRNPDYLNNYAVYTAYEAGLPDSAVDMRFAMERRGAENARRFHASASLSTSCWINTHYWATAVDRSQEWLDLLESLHIDFPPDCEREAALFESLAEGEWARAEEVLRASPGDWRWPDAVEVGSRQLVPLRGRVHEAHRLLPPENPEKKAWARGRWHEISLLLLELAYDLQPTGPVEESSVWARLPKELEGRGREEVVAYVVLGVREALVGDTLEAERVARRLQAMRDSATSRTFEGAFEPWFALMEVGPAFRRGDWPTVVSTLEPVAAHIQEPGVGSLAGDAYLVWWLLAEAHEGLGEPASAIPYLASILRRPTYGIQDWTLQGFIHPAARFKLAGLYVDVGNDEKAWEHYRIFLDTFTDPDPEFQWMVEEARPALDQAEGLATAAPRVQETKRAFGRTEG